MRRTPSQSCINDHLLEQGTIQTRKDKPLKNQRARSQMVPLGLQLRPGPEAGWTAPQKPFLRHSNENNNSSLSKLVERHVTF